MTGIREIISVRSSIEAHREMMEDLGGGTHCLPPMRDPDIVDISVKVVSGKAEEILEAFYDGRLDLVIREAGE